MLVQRGSDGYVNQKGDHGPSASSADRVGGSNSMIANVRAIRYSQLDHCVTTLNSINSVQKLNYSLMTHPSKAQYHFRPIQTF